MIDAQFQPRKMSDRPHVVPKGSTNFAMISQFVEIPEDMVFTEEYSVRAARIAVYTLLGINKPICKVTPYNKDPKVLKKALETALSLAVSFFYFCFFFAINQHSCDNNDSNYHNYYVWCNICIITR
mgnify:CR=1 FL=1